MLIIGNGVVVTRDTDNPFIKNGSVVCDGDEIIEIGDFNDLRKKYKDAEFVDAKGGVIMPGLINMHHHIYSAFARGLAVKNYSPKSFLDILEGMWWKLDRTMNLEDVYHSAAVTYLECIKNGVTTVFDHHASFGEIEGSLFRISDVAKNAGLRTCLCYEVSDRDGEEKRRASIKENYDFIKYALENGNDMQYGMMGMHASFTLSDKSLDECVSDLPKNTGCHIHVAEAMYDAKDSLQKNGKSIVKRLKEHGILGEKTIAAHCIHIPHEDLLTLKNSDTMVVHNPESNMGNAVGAANIPEMYEEGLLLGLGTDGYTSDMFESYKVANCLAKHNSQSPSVGWTEIPDMLFNGNAKMANRYFKKPLGVLKKGAAADVIVLNYHPFTELTADNINGHLLFGANGAFVNSTIVSGKVLMENREIKAFDEEKVLADALKQSKDFWGRVNA